MSESIDSSQEQIILRHKEDSVQLRQLTPEDAQTYYDLLAYDLEYLLQYDDRIAEKYPDSEAFKDSIKNPHNKEAYRFAVWDEDTIVGGINLVPTEDGKAELGFWTGKPYTGHGYASRSQQLLLAFAFDTLRLEEVFCDVLNDNTASRRLVEKIGFRISKEFVDEEGASMVRYTLSKPERQG